MKQACKILFIFLLFKNIIYPAQAKSKIDAIFDLLATCSVEEKDVIISKITKSSKLAEAIREGNVVQIETILETRVDVNTSSVLDSFVISVDLLTIVKLNEIIPLLINAGINLNYNIGTYNFFGMIPYEHDKTCLSNVIRRDNEKNIRLICQHGAFIDPICQTKKSNRLTPLTLAAYFGHIKNVEVLLEFGALLNPIKKGLGNLNPVDIANQASTILLDVSKRHKDIIALLKAEPKKRLKYLDRLKKLLTNAHEIPAAVADVVCDYTFDREELIEKRKA